MDCCALRLTARVVKLLLSGIDCAINRTANATEGKAPPVNAGSKAVEKAVQYAIDSAPVWLISWMSGPELIRQKVIAPLDVRSSAALR